VVASWVRVGVVEGFLRSCELWSLPLARASLLILCARGFVAGRLTRSHAGLRRLRRKGLGCLRQGWGGRGVLDASLKLFSLPLARASLLILCARGCVASLLTRSHARF
jgi:hypothetical protein